MLKFILYSFSFLVFSLHLIFAQENFSAKTNFTTGNYPVSVNSGDFNGDGKLDMAVVNNLSNTISVFLNTTTPGAATPSFTGKTDFATGNYPYSICINDLNGDGKLDIAVPNYGSNTISVLLNTTAPGASTPSFASKTDFYTGAWPSSVCIGDFNGDGMPDMAVADQGAGTVSVLLNTTTPGASTPTFASDVLFITGYNAISVDCGDLNGDGKVDLVVDNYFSCTISVLLNTTTPGNTIPSFTEKTDFPIGGYTNSVRLADFNGDGKLDITATSTALNKVAVFLNQTTPGAATPFFTPKTDFYIASQMNFVNIGDFNCDGKPDIAATSSNNYVVLLINSTIPGSFSPAFDVRIDFLTDGGRPISICASDFNCDGKPDLAVINYSSNTVSVFLNTMSLGVPSPSFTAKTDINISGNIFCISIDDLNGDGKPDFAIVSGSSSISVLLNTTAPGASIPSFTARTDFTTGTYPYDISIDDLNGDGKPDIAVTSKTSNSVSVLLNTTAPGASVPSFTTKTDFSTGSSPYGISIDDLNGDGKPDMAVTNPSANLVSVFLNTTTPGASVPSFTAKTDFITGATPYIISIDDLNGDGKPDMIVTNYESNTVSVFLNTTTPGASIPSFTARTDFTTGTYPYDISIDDLNGDGKPDIAVTNLLANSVSVFLNTTSPGALVPSFTTKIDFSTGSSPYGISIDDLNGDGKPDMAVINQNINKVSVFLNTTTPGASVPSFTAKTDFNTGTTSYDISTDDLNGDGKPDIAVTNFGSDNISILLNNASLPMPLPVELTEFTASAGDNSVILHWNTATEINNYGFEIQRRILLSPSLINEDVPLGGKGDWETIGFVSGSGNSNSPKEYSFVDANPFEKNTPSGNLQYRLKQIDLDGGYQYFAQMTEVNFSMTDVKEKQLPKEFILEQNYPNPFNPITTIKYSIPSKSLSLPGSIADETGNVMVTLKIYNLLGKEVASLVNEEKQPGDYQVEFNASNLSSGIYMYRLTAGKFTSAKKLLLMK